MTIPNDKLHAELSYILNSFKIISFGENWNFASTNIYLKNIRM